MQHALQNADWVHYSLGLPRNMLLLQEVACRAWMHATGFTNTSVARRHGDASRRDQANRPNQHLELAINPAVKKSGVSMCTNVITYDFDLCPRCPGLAP